jgi:hypothetical protein
MRIVLRLTKLEIDALQGGQKEPVLVSEIEINEVLVDLGPRCNLIDPGTIVVRRGVIRRIQWRSVEVRVVMCIVRTT